MSRILRKPKLAALVVGVGVVAIAGIAYAFFTTSGAGTGTASVGTSSALTIHGTSASTLYPGTSSTVSFTVDNPSSGHQQLGTVTLSAVHACTGAGSSWNGTSCTSGGTEATGCESFDTSSSSSSDNFSMVPVTSNQDIAGNASGATVTATGTLAMNNLASSQDACKSANLTLSFTS